VSTFEAIHVHLEQGEPVGEFAVPDFNGSRRFVEHLAGLERSRQTAEFDLFGFALALACEQK
jgi:hypothetical protein